jgi:hypothetical protein
VTGLLPGGATVLIYGGMGTATSGLGADLTPNAARTIPLAALRHETTLGEAKA